jgi:prepilin-type N-terminal cleavage/methylation domain-containing protein
LRRRQVHNPITTRRRGFTLVELLAALGISLLLIASVMASLNIYVRLTTSSEFSVERQQVTRALLQQMTRDVSSIVFTVPEEETEDDTTATEDEATETVTVEIQDPASSISAASVGLMGDAQSLVLNVSRPSLNLSYTSPFTAASLNERTSDMLSVSYFMAAPGGSSLAAAVSSNDVSLTPGSDGLGLARLEGDRMAIDHADLQMDTQLLAAAAKIIAPEVVSIQFRYFDGTTWLDMWDSTAYGALPQAIEVTLGFRAPLVEQDSSLTASPAPTVEEYVRHVIYVPIAEPYSASSTY